MSLDRKAEENLDAARLLLDREDPLPNAACSRAYYAAYQACWVAMTDRGIEVPERASGRYFDHKNLPFEAAREGLLTDDEREDLEELESQRVVADYHDDELTAEQAKPMLLNAEKLLGKLLRRKH